MVGGGLHFGNHLPPQDLPKPLPANKSKKPKLKLQKLKLELKTPSCCAMQEDNCNAKTNKRTEC